MKYVIVLALLLSACSTRNDGFNWGHEAIIYTEGQRK